MNSKKKLWPVVASVDRLLIQIGLLWLLAMNIAVANSASPLDSLRYFQDVDQSVTIDKVLANSEIAWQKADGTSLNLGFVSEPVWVLFEVPEEGEESTKLFEIANHNISRVDFYIASQDGDRWALESSFHTSDQKPRSERAYPHRNFVFPINVSNVKRKLVAVKVENSFSMKLPMYLWEEESFHKQDTDRMLFQGIYFGTVLIMALYNLCIYFFVKDKSYAAYVVFIVLFALIVAVDKGLAAEYLWPGAGEYDFQLYLILVALGAASSVVFTVHFLSLREHSPRAARAFDYLICFWLAVAVIAVISPSIWVLFIEILVLIPGGTALFLAGVYSWRKGVAAAPYYTVSWFVVILGVVVYCAYLLGLLSVSMVTEYALQVGNMIEATLLSLGLAYRIKALDEEKRQANAMTKAKSDFLATMSHEIRTPMNGILGMAQLLKDTKLSQQQDGYLSTILGSGQTLLTVLNDILDYSKIEAGKLKTESIGFNIRRLVDETAGVFAVKATEKHVYYNTYLSPHVPIKIDGDPTRIRQIITNFLSNAFKFTESGQVLIHVKREPGEPWLRFEVHDSGIGIPLEKLDSVFQEFTQADNSTSRQFGGTGLGLPISRRLVEMMGGGIGVESVVNEGSVFWFTLPIKNEVPFDRVTSQELMGDIKSSRFLQITPTVTFSEQLKSYSELWSFSFASKQTIHQALTDLDGNKPYDFVIIDQYCEDFSYDVISKELMNASWAKGAQLILTMKPGADRLAFSKLRPEPWIEEYPVSITRIQLRFLGAQGVSLSEKEPVNEVKDYSQMRLLLVEDNPVNAKVATAFINKLGIEPKVVDSGEEALELICHEKREFDLIFMDCEMPGIDGYTTTKHIRDWELLNNKEPQNICALSAHAMDSHKDKCLDAGMNDFLTKPLVFEHLKDKIDSAFKEVLDSMEIH